MKRDNINYTLVGAFVLVSMALLIYALARLGGHGDKHDIYFATFSNVAGIADGSLVTYDGYQVGHVHSIAPIVRDGRISYRVQLLFKQGWKIPVDSAASISSSGLLSGQIVDVKQGKSQELLKSGQDIIVVDNQPLLAALGNLVGDLGSITRDDIHPTLQNLNRRIDNISGLIEHKGGITLDQANVTLVRLNTVAENLGQLLNEENRSRMGSILKNGELASMNFGQLLNTDNSQHFSSILKNGDLASERVNQTMNEFEHTATEIHYVMQQTQTILSNLERASLHMNELSRQLRESPSSIFSSSAPSDFQEAKK